MHCGVRRRATSSAPALTEALDLGAYESRRLWSVLEDADRAGVALIHGDAALGSIPAPVTGELTLDVVVVEDGDSAGRRRWEAGDEALTPALFIGDHGPSACVAGEPDLPPGRRPLRPAAGPPGRHRPRCAGWCSRARRSISPLGSASGSPTSCRRRCGTWRGWVSSDTARSSCPACPRPELALRRADGVTHHAADVEWGWRYRVGERVEEGGVVGRAAPRAVFPRFPRPADPAGLAPAGAEGLERFGLVDDHGRPTSAPVRLTGMNTARLATERPPELQQRTELALAVDGTPPDFRDVGSSLRVELSTAQPQGERDWFDLGVTVSVDGEDIPFALLFTALAAGDSHLVLPSGTWFDIRRAEFDRLRALIEGRGPSRTSSARGLRISRYQAGLWDELVELGVVAEQSERWARDVRALLDVDAAGRRPRPPGSTRAAALPAAGLPVALGPVGRRARRRARRRHGAGQDPAGAGAGVPGEGGRGADRTGTGRGPDQRGVNWAREAARFAPGLASGPSTATGRKLGVPLAEVVDGADLVITSYTLLRLGEDDYRGLPWSGLLLDEAQFVKNHAAKTYAAARRLPARFKLAITGTPVENNLMDLWSMLSIVAPGLFPDPQRFTEHYRTPIERGGNPRCWPRCAAGSGR